MQTTPTSTGSLRSANTIVTYARSVRAFGYWLVRQGIVACPLLSSEKMPKSSPKRLQFVEPEDFARLLEACRPPGEAGPHADRATARNQALLWLLWESGLLVSEVCALRVGDVLALQGMVEIAGKGAKARRIALGAEGQRAMRSHLECARLREKNVEPCDEDFLFCTESDHPLTVNALELIFLRLNQRAGLVGKQISPTTLRDTFAVRYLQTGGHLGALQEMLGLTELASARRYQRLCEQLRDEQQDKGNPENHSF